MAPEISFQRMRVLIDGHDSEGRLVLADGQLAAVIVRLDGEAHDPAARGSWHLEAGFGRCAAPLDDTLIWGTPEEAGRWVAARLAAGPPVG